MIDMFSNLKLQLGSLYDLLFSMANSQYSLDFLFKNQHNLVYPRI